MPASSCSVLSCVGRGLEMGQSLGANLSSGVGIEVLRWANLPSDVGREVLRWASLPSGVGRGLEMGQSPVCLKDSEFQC
jgi:hypothetical protein